MQRNSNKYIVRAIQPTSFFKRIAESMVMALVIFSIALPLVMISTPVKGNLFITFTISLMIFFSFSFYKIVSNSATLIYEIYRINDIVGFKTLHFRKQNVFEIPLEQLTLEITPHGNYDCKLVISRQSMPLIKQVSNKYWKKSDFEVVAKLLGVKIL